MNAAEFGLDEESVRNKAYEIWQLRGSPLGSPEQDWYQAVESLRTPDSAGEVRAVRAGRKTPRNALKSLAEPAERGARRGSKQRVAVTR